MIRVIIADDHDLIRRGVKQSLSETKSITVTDEAAEWTELIHKISRNEYDILLLDINMPGRSGIDVLRDIKKLRPTLPVLILSIYEDENYVLKAIARGADGYISKASNTDDLIKAIEKVVKGGQYISDSLAEKVLFHSKSKTIDLIHKSLSDREMEVMLKIIEGKPPKLIAKELSISVKTVNAHREHILRKMNMKSTGELIRYGIKHKLCQ
jgi:DNA-binding NarL/FixJ family response regulator